MGGIHIFYFDWLYHTIHYNELQYIQQLAMFDSNQYTYINGNKSSTYSTTM